ncbi:MAG: hypothetical protein DCC49_11295 [Acidobacteria bacterium]|nr:MAG: hypothetical protein DCC49_11295 [Acidobacteriota bacterium]
MQRSTRAPPPEPQPAAGATRYFETNVGQFPEGVRFIAEVGAYQVVFYDDSFDLVAGIYDEKKKPKKPKCDTARPGPTDLDCLEAPKIVTTKIRFDSATAVPVAGGDLAGLANYMIPSGTFIGVERRAQITYPGIYPGIDLRFRFDEEGLLKFDVVVAPGADPGQFGLKATQGAKFEIAPDGGFSILSDSGIYRQAKPVVIPDDASTPPEASFYLDHKILRVTLDGPAPASGYVIDPGIEFVSYSASAPNFSVDYSNVNLGNGEFITTGPFSSSFIPGGMNVRVRKWNSNGIIEEGIFGGSKDEIAAQIAYGEAGGVKKLAVVGWTNSPNFPLFDPIQSTLQDQGDGFITRIDFNTLMPELIPGGFSTFFGGSSPTGADQSARDENAHSIEFAPGSIEKLYVAGLTNARDLPVTNAYQGSNRSADLTGRDAWFAEIDINGGSPVLNMSSYLGGSDDEDFDVRLRVSPSTGNLWIDGTTNSDDFFLTPPPTGFQPAKGAGSDGFLAEFSPATPPTLLGGTFIGGNGDDYIYDLAIRPGADRALISMKTGSSDMVTTPGAYSSAYSGGDDAFVLEVGPAAASRVLATYIGGPNFDFAVGVGALDGDRIGIGAGADGLRPTDAGGFPYKNPENPPAPAAENFIGSNAVNATALVLDSSKTGDDQLEFSRCLAAKNTWPEELNYADGKLAISGQRVSISFSGAVESDLPAYNNSSPPYDTYHPYNTSNFVGFSWVLDENSYDPFAIRRQTGNVIATAGQPIVIEADIAGSPRLNPTSPPNQTDGSVRIEFTPDGGTPQTYLMGPAGPTRPDIWFGSFVIGTQPGTVRVIAKDGFCDVTRAASRIDLVTDAITGRITGDDPAPGKPPMAGAHVVAENQGTGQVFDAFTDADGYYAIRPVPTGSYKLTVSPANTPGSTDGWADGYSEGKTSLQEALAFDAPSFNDEVLQRAGTICGVVTGEDTGGAPLTGGINATFYNPSNGHTVGGSVEADPITGEYCKWLPDGLYYALYNAPTTAKPLGWIPYSLVWSPPDQLFDPANALPGSFTYFDVDPGAGVVYNPVLPRVWNVTGSVRLPGDITPGLAGKVGSYWAISPNGQYHAVDVPGSGDFIYPLPDGDWWLVFVYSGCDVLFYNNKTAPPFDTVTVSGGPVDLTANTQYLSCPP